MAENGCYLKLYVLHMTDTLLDNICLVATILSTLRTYHEVSQFLATDKSGELPRDQQRKGVRDGALASSSWYMGLLTRHLLGSLLSLLLSLWGLQRKLVA